MKFRGGRKKSRQYRNRTKRAAEIVARFYRAYPQLRDTGNTTSLRFLSEGEVENYWNLWAHDLNVPVEMLKEPNRTRLKLMYCGQTVGKWSMTRQNTDNIPRSP